MARLIRLKNQILDLDAIQWAAYVPADEKVPDAKSPSSLHLILGGVPVDLDQDDDADALWKIIVEKLKVDWVDEPPPAPYVRGK
jgi:hypothetical protein